MLLRPNEFAEYGLNYKDAADVRDLAAIEAVIRAETHNSFHVRGTAFAGESRDGVLFASSPFVKVGDTIEVEGAGINDGLYLVETVGEGFMTLNGALFDCEHCLASLVRYPSDVKRGAMAMLAYDRTGAGSKRGIASENLSRHSVSYVQPSADNTVAGYPIDIVAFLGSYRRARF